MISSTLREGGGLGLGKFNSGCNTTVISSKLGVGVSKELHKDDISGKVSQKVYYLDEII